MYSIYKCTVPDCGQSMTNKSFTFHKFPKNEDLRSKWVERCRITKKLSERSYVCSSHFDAGDYMTSNGPRKLLKKYAVPSVFPEKPSNQAEDAGNVADDAVSDFVQEPATRSKFLPSILRKRVKLDPPAQSINEPNVQTMSADQEAGSSPSLVREEPSTTTQDLQECDMGSRVQGFTIASARKDAPPVELAHQCNHEGDLDDYGHMEDVGDRDSSDGPDHSFGLDEAVEELESAVAEIEIEGNGTITEEEIDIIREKGRQFQENRGKDRLTLLDLIRNDEDLVAFTGINTELLDSLCAVVSKCEGEAYQEKFATSVRGRIVMCLCKLRLNLSFRCISVLFGINRNTCSTNISYMIQLLAGILEQFILRPTREQCRSNLPRCFSKFPKTRIVLDCTEIPVEKPHCLKCRLRWYSHYKGCETVKLLVGMDPSGVITYISPAYGGRISDKEIFKQSGLLEKLDPTVDAIMVDKGFDIDLECLASHIQLIIPPKLSKKTRFTLEESIQTNEIAAARVHVERVIQRMKLWKILKDKITLTTVPYIDDIVKVIAALVNLRNPLLAEDKF
ncbi:hypothetical protein QAD02_020611 [Eretmocerus hayati]|uniref:Uncharacterized protein n=1 Tax=Eretmocerus hayati TaxID=131215 RepID=A0ACC2PMY8_9HYME|nr:hypothetical protein QAD02_020611 [Eretmocerus hayati]